MVERIRDDLKSIAPLWLNQWLPFLFSIFVLDCDTLIIQKSHPELCTMKRKTTQISSTGH